MAKRKARKKSPVPQMHPRERLTKKAEAAISAYASHKAGKIGFNYHYFMVKWVLEAERQPRKRLYGQLKEWGYRWHPRIGAWLQ